MMRDHSSNTEDQAGISARLDAYQVDDRDRDEPSNAADHNCRDIPFPEDCWGCMAFVRAAELQDAREEQRTWDEYKRSQRDEEAS